MEMDHGGGEFLYLLTQQGPEGLAWADNDFPRQNFETVPIAFPKLTKEESVSDCLQTLQRDPRHLASLLQMNCPTRSRVFMSHLGQDHPTPLGACHLQLTSSIQIQLKLSFARVCQ